MSIYPVQVEIFTYVIINLLILATTLQDWLNQLFISSMTSVNNSTNLSLEVGLSTVQ